ncbi:MAG: anaerobic ribonucleoside-triphosphate reductase, partial [archaeon]
MLLPKHIKKRDGSLDRFNPIKMREAINAAVKTVIFQDQDEATDLIYSEVKKKITDRFNGNIPEIEDIEELIMEVSRDVGYNAVSISYRNYSNERKEVREFLAVQAKGGERSTTDAALLIESDSKDSLEKWDRERIIKQLKEEANLSHSYAEKIAKKVENSIVGLYKRGGIKRFQTTDIRMLVDLVLKEEDLETQRKKQALLSLPSQDFHKIVFSRSCENSNIACNNPEAVNLEVAERIQKPWALRNIFSDDVANAHLNGTIHIHDLGYPTRAYCSSHSLEYIKKYGLGKILENLESKSKSPNSAAVLNQHVQTFLASMQAHYAGALGFGFLNILYAPLLNRPVKIVKGRFNEKKMILERNDYDKLVEQKVLSENKEEDNYFKIEEEKIELKEVSQKEYDQTAQNLIFAASQNAFSRGGQTLFIDFNLHTGVPSYMKHVPAIGPGGKYMVIMPDNSVKSIDNAPRIKTKDPNHPKNGDANDAGLKDDLKGGHILTYGDFEPASQKFAKSLIEVWRRGDKDGRPFHFPKCDLHVDKHSYTDEKQIKLLDFATQVSAENGSVYFMFDRGDGAVLAQCCRLREKVEDTSMLKYPERLRFTGFQNVTINLAQAAYKGVNLQGTLDEIDNAMEIALKAHKQRAVFMQELLETDGSPMRNLGRISDDGFPYIELKKSTYIVGNIGLNESVKALTGKNLHESEEAFNTGLRIIAHMYKKIHDFKKMTGLKFVIEETPAESATRRFSFVDRKKYDMAKKIIEGTEENPYYTNSIHFTPNADVGIIDRIVGQSKFHDMIEAGAIIHAWVGEQRPSKEAIWNLVKNTLENTRSTQLVISPTYTECNSCGTVMGGEKKLCSNPECINSVEETVDLNKLNVVTRIVGYNSSLKQWNGSQLQIYEDRKKAEMEYAGVSNGRDMSWLHNPTPNGHLTIMQFGKKNCGYCEKTKKTVEKVLKELGFNGEIKFKIHYLDELEDDEGLVNASKYCVPFDTVPTVVVAGKQSYWKKTTEYGSDTECEDGACGVGSGQEKLITEEEIRQAITERMPGYN